MKKLNIIKSVTLVAASSFLVMGCRVGVRGPGGEAVVSAAPAGGVVYADAPPPPPLDDPQVGVAPGPDFVWVGGGWVWGGHRWTWEHGRWAHPPYAGARWVPHHYAYRNGRHVFERGGWR